MTKKNYTVLAIFLVTILTTSLHFATMSQFSPYVVLEELYYLPLILGVLRFGLRGAIATWLFVSAAYLPFFFPPWTTSFPGYADRGLHLVLSGVVAIVVGLLVERERRYRIQGERERYLAGLGRVATVVVHDLKNPLISILGFARRIIEGRGDSDQAARKILESAQSMQRIVNEVLDFAKPMQLVPKKGDIGKTIQCAVEVCRTKSLERGVVLKVNLPAEPISVALDSFQVERALVNLIDNAIDASCSGEQVTITSYYDGKGLFITVKDQGTGMDSETLAHLFEPFYTSKADGTGLGMPIARKIFEEHGGILTIISKQGGGTEVTAWLPGSGSSAGIVRPAQNSAVPLPSE